MILRRKGKISRKVKDRTTSPSDINPGGGAEGGDA